MTATDLLTQIATATPDSPRSRRALWGGRAMSGFAVLWAGYLGGAVATHVRVGNPLLSQALFPVYLRSSSGAASGYATNGCARRCHSGECNGCDIPE